MFRPNSPQISALRTPTFLLCFIATLLAVLTIGTCDAATRIVRIRNDSGGSLGDYYLRFSKVRQSGEYVVIDGRCFSACTLVLGLIPRDRICVTPRAALGFHVASIPDGNGGFRFDHDGTQLIYELYPKFIKAQLKRRGGLNSHMIVLRAPVLAQFYSRCRTTK